MLQNKTICFVVTEDWYFWSHRLLLARAARDAGAKVIVVASMKDHKERIEAENFTPVHMPFNRSGLNPARDLLALYRLYRIYKKFKPDLVHHIAVKPILLGSLAALAIDKPSIVNTFAGLGFLYMSEKPTARFARKIVQTVVKWCSRRKNARLIVQNADDRSVFLEIGIAPQHITLIPGSGVDMSEYTPTAPPKMSPIKAVCVSRMLADKGIYELVEAATILKDKGVELKVRLVGGTDDNPRSITREQLTAWKRENIVDVAGHSHDVPAEYAKAHIAVLPSYREGLPKSLLEAAAAGRPIVSCDTPGCRDICIDGQTGLLVPPKDPIALANALERLATNAPLREKLGTNARELVEQKFSAKVINRSTLGVYEELFSIE